MSSWPCTTGVFVIQGDTVFPGVSSRRADSAPTWNPDCRPEVQVEHKLNQATVERLEPRDRPYVCYDRTPPGFGVRVTPNGVRSWVFEYRPGGGRRSSTRRITIGRID